MLRTRDATFQPTFAVQFDGQADSRTDPIASARLRRHRLGFRARLRDDLIIVRLQINAWVDALELLDVFVDVGPHRLFAIRAGQFKVPFTRYRQWSFTSGAMVDWALSSVYFGAERQLGLMTHGDAKGWSYEFGVFNGQNRRASHAVGVPLLYGEAIGNPSDLVDPAGVDRIHPELVVHGAYRSPGTDANRLSDAAGGPLRYAVDLSVAWDIRPEPTEDLQVRVAPELLLKWNHLSWHVGWYQTWHRRTTGVTGLGPWGPMTEASYRITPLLEIAARYAHIQVPRGMTDDTLRDPGDRNPSDLRSQDELGPGFNVYLVGDSLKLQADIRWIRTQPGSGQADDDVSARAQVQIAF